MEEVEARFAGLLRNSGGDDDDVAVLGVLIGAVCDTDGIRCEA